MTWCLRKQFYLNNIKGTLGEMDETLWKIFTKTALLLIMLQKSVSRRCSTCYQTGLTEESHVANTHAGPFTLPPEGQREPLFWLLLRIRSPYFQELNSKGPCFSVSSSQIKGYSVLATFSNKVVNSTFYFCKAKLTSRETILGTTVLKKA